MKNEISRSKHRLNGHARGIDGIKSFTPKGLLPCSAVGAAIAVLCALLLTFAVSAILYSTSDPSRLITPAAFSVLYISALAGGFAAARFNRGSALLCGLLVGAMLVVFGFTVSLPISRSLSSDYGIPVEIGLRVAVIVCSLIGAFIGVTKNTTNVKKRKIHKKR